MNKYHRYLNLNIGKPNIDFSMLDTNNKTWQEFHKTLKLNQLNSPDFVNMLRSLGMKSTWIEVFCTPPNQSGVIHSDNTTWSDWAKIIFQYGAQGSTMRWWESKQTSTVNTKDYAPTHHGDVFIAKEENCDLVYEADVANASLINAGPLHSSYNPTNEKRITVTVALFTLDGKRVLWDQALHLLDPYIAS